MKNLKLTIDLLPKGAWNNDFSKTLPKKEWDILGQKCYERANHKCQICGYVTDELDAHEVWNFDIKTKTQTLVDIIALCSKCHGVKHFRNSKRLGYEEDAKHHFVKVNACTELDFATHLVQEQLDFKERNKVYRWRINANLSKFGLENATLKEKNIPFILNPYEDVDWKQVSYSDILNLFEIKRNQNILGAPKIISIEIDNYQGTIQIKSLFVDRIEWHLDGKKIKTKYNVVGPFNICLKVEGLIGKQLKFKLVGIGGITISKSFRLLSQEVI